MEGVADDEPEPRVVVVTSASQLPRSFLAPSEKGAGVLVGFDCEGVELSREGRLCVMQVCMEGVVYLVDAVAGEEGLMLACKAALESPQVIKVVHDCRRDAEALFYQFGIILQGVFDIQVAHSLIKGEHDSENISFVSLLACPEYCGAVYGNKEVMRQKLHKDPNLWVHRPWTPEMLKAASDDVRFLPRVFLRMVPLLSSPAARAKGLLHSLALRSSLRARSFTCSTSEDSASWPPPAPYPPIPGTGEGAAESGAACAGGSGEEALSVVSVPKGCMGCVIGKKGASIKAIRHACPRSEIFTGGNKGPDDKVFVIGPKPELKMAEAIIRGKFTRIPA